MVTLSPASVVVIHFPFSDLSATKLRPAIVLANAGQGDWFLCQVTSRASADPDADRLASENLSKGSLNTVSFARPLKLFTANIDLINKRVAIVDDDTFREILTATIKSLQKNLPTKRKTKSGDKPQ